LRGSVQAVWPQLHDDDVRDVRRGQAAFFETFRFRFSDPELQFLRHAPRRFVQTGNGAWFDHHGFEAASVSTGLLGAGSDPNVFDVVGNSRRCIGLTGLPMLSNSKRAANRKAVDLE
jgi:hypothetical protein